MPVEGIRQASQLLDTEDTSSIWSPAIWQRVRHQGIRDGTVDGIFCQWDFWKGFKPSTGIGASEAYWDQGLMVFGDTGATITQNAGVGAAGYVSIGSDGDNEGAAIRQPNGPFKLSRATKRFAFEAAIRTSTIADTKHGIFCGLLEDVAATATVPIAAAGTLADKNFVGFHRLEGDGDMLDLVYKADGVTQVTVKADAITLVADTLTKIGMTYDPAPDFEVSQNYVLRFWKNGRVIATTSSSAAGYKQVPSADGTDFPNDIGLGFIFCVLNATATTPGTSGISRVRIAQEL